MGRHQTLSDDEILYRARSVFVDRGYAARTRDIAAAVGLSWPAIVLRFGCKWELFKRAIGDPLRAPSEIGSMACSDLRELLERLSTELGHRWPGRLQYRLAATGSAQDDTGQLTDWLSSILATHATRGTVRSDLPATSLAGIVLALLVGDVAQRFVKHDANSCADRVFIGEVLSALGPSTQQRAAAG